MGTIALKAIRTQKRLMQKKLAHEAEVSIRALQNYESGKRKPDVDTAQRLARALGVSVGELFPLPGEADNPKSNVSK